MEVSLKWFILCVLFMALLSTGAIAMNENESDKERFVKSRNVRAENLQSSKNSSMAGRSDDSWNEHAVDNPEEIASLVDIEDNSHDQENALSADSAQQSHLVLSNSN